MSRSLRTRRYASCNYTLLKKWSVGGRPGRCNSDGEAQ